MAPILANLETFGVSPTWGFLSSAAPLSCFRDPYFQRWDELATELPRLTSSRLLQQEIQGLPLLDVSKLSSELEFRRAYVVLAFLVHAYVWVGKEDGTPAETIPPQLAEPFLAVCEYLGMAPVLSYAGLCLWNWNLTKESATRELEIGELADLDTVMSFTGTRGEAAFYHVPVLIEAEGGPLIPLLLDAIADGSRNDASSVTEALKHSADVFIRMGRHLPKMYPVLDANMFYHKLRPFLGGGKGMEAKGLPRGMVFQRTDGTEQEAKCIGGSAAQSALFQFLDSVLGVEHKRPEGAEVTMFEEMRSYMPGKHREFLEIVAKLPSIRSFVESKRENKELSAAYEDCMKQLRLWRGKHIAVVSKYIVRPARGSESGTAEGKAESEADGFVGRKGEDLQGTAGSALIPFLQQTRDETRGI